MEIESVIVISGFVSMKRFSLSLTQETKEEFILPLASVVREFKIVLMVTPIS